MQQARLVLLPPLCPADVQLNFFHDLEGRSAPLELLATMVTWVRLARLTPMECSALMAGGVRDEDAWYDLAHRWMVEARVALQERTARIDAIEVVLGELEPRMRRNFELSFYLKTHFPEASREQRPQAACFH